MGNVFSACSSADDTESSLHFFGGGHDFREISEEMKEAITSHPNYPSMQTFLAMAKPKKRVISQEQQAAADLVLRKSMIEASEEYDYDLLPNDLLWQIVNYCNSLDDFIPAGMSINHLIFSASSVDLISILKCAGQCVAPLMPNPERVGRYAAGRTTQGLPYREKPKDHPEYMPKPDEALHYKALEGSMLNRYQSGMILKRRPSCTAKLCAVEGCANCTFHITGICSEHLNEKERGIRIFMKPVDSCK